MLGRPSGEVRGDRPGRGVVDGGVGLAVEGDGVGLVVRLRGLFGSVSVTVRVVVRVDVSPPGVVTVSELRSAGPACRSGGRGRASTSVTVPSGSVVVGCRPCRSTVTVVPGRRRRSSRVVRRSPPVGRCSTW